MIAPRPSPRRSDEVSSTSALSCPPVDFQISHSFDAPVERVAAAILERDYQRSLSGVGQLKSREVLSQEADDDGRVTRRIRCVLGIDLGAAKRFVGDGEPAWIEEATWYPELQRWEWVIHPEVGADLLAAQGAIALRSEDDTTVRRVEGSVGVRVPLYGGRVERWIVDGLERAYDDEAVRLAQWLERENV